MVDLDVKITVTKDIGLCSDLMDRNFTKNGIIMMGEEALYIPILFIYQMFCLC